MTSEVYLVRTGDSPSVEAQVAAIEKIYDAAGVSDKIDTGEYVALKIHVGEDKNTTSIKPELMAALVEKVRQKEALPFLTETATLYRGQRDNAVRHLMHAQKRGFGFEKMGAPFIMADGLAGDSEIEVEINGELNKSVFIAREARMADFLLVVSHMTGHIATAFGSTLKNLGMGLASRRGKLRQHSAVSPVIDPDKCVFCGKCIQWCPEDAITGVDNKAVINRDKCVGCGQCLTVCRFDAVKFDWGRESSLIQKDVAEHALGAVKDKKAFYINVLINMTIDCDCFPVDQKKIMADIGIMGSWDPVALDQASLDLTKEENGVNLAKASYPALNPEIQLNHGEKIGLGSRSYELKTV